MPGWRRLDGSPRVALSGIWPVGLITPAEELLLPGQGVVGAALRAGPPVSFPGFLPAVSGRSGAPCIVVWSKTGPLRPSYSKRLCFRMKTILSNQTVDIPENGTRPGVCIFLTSLLHALYLVARPHEYVLS